MPTSNQSMTHFPLGLSIGDIPVEVVKTKDAAGGTPYRISLPPFTGYGTVRTAFYNGLCSSTSNPILTIHSDVSGPTSLQLLDMVSNTNDPYTIRVTVMTYRSSTNNNRARILVEYQVGASATSGLVYVSDLTNQYYNATDGQIYLTLSNVISTVGLCY